jgi:hypothetical protein
MDQKKIILITFAIIAMAAAAAAGLFFYSQNQKNASQTPTQTKEEPKKEEIKKEEAINPLRLNYTMNNSGPGGANTISYYIESKKTCGNREAYLGLTKIQNNNDPTRSQYAKFSVFTDNGQMAASQWNKETSLAFDDAVSYYNELDMPFLINDIFSYAGKNFNSNEYWETKDPIVLKDVSTGRSTGSYSIIPLEENSSSSIPCKNFKIIAKTTNTDGYFTACVAKKIGDVDLPTIVSFAFENEQGPSWRLESFTNEKSGIAWVPQCLTPVACNYVAEPSQAEKISCSAKGGNFESDSDEQGCIREYKCLTEIERAETEISKFQNPSCQINQNVLNKYLQCRKNNKPNLEQTGYDDKGCLTDINCR